MPELLASFLGAVLRHALTGAGIYFVSHGYFTQSDAENYTAGFVLFLLGLLWSLWQKYGHRVQVLTALSSQPGTTEEELKTKIAQGRGASALGAVLVLALGLGALTGTAACRSGGAFRLAAAADTTLTSALHQTYLDEQTTYKAGLYDRHKHDEYLRIIRRADGDAVALTDALIAYKQATATGQRPSLPVLIVETKAGLQAILDDLSALPRAHPLIVALQKAIGLLG